MNARIKTLYTRLLHVYLIHYVAIQIWYYYSVNSDIDGEQA